jgi:hypothetical protein
MSFPLLTKDRLCRTLHPSRRSRSQNQHRNKAPSSRHLDQILCVLRLPTRNQSPFSRSNANLNQRNQCRQLLRCQLPRRHSCQVRV